jgi:hypothetical protein
MIHKSIILPVVLHGCISLTLREEHRLRVFENRVLRRIFGPKSDAPFLLGFIFNSVDGDKFLRNVQLTLI